MKENKIMKKNRLFFPRGKHFFRGIITFVYDSFQNRTGRYICEKNEVNL